MLANRNWKSNKCYICLRITTDSLRGLYQMPWIETRLAVCKANTLASALAISPLQMLYFNVVFATIMSYILLFSFRPKKFGMNDEWLATFALLKTVSLMLSWKSKFYAFLRFLMLCFFLWININENPYFIYHMCYIMPITREPMSLQLYLNMPSMAYPSNTLR